MIVLGLDPGTATTGFGLLRADTLTCTIKLSDSDWIKTDKDEIRGNRLVMIHQEVKRIIDLHKPDALAIAICHSRKVFDKIGQIKNVGEEVKKYELT